MIKLIFILLTKNNFEFYYSMCCLLFVFNNYIINYFKAKESIIILKLFVPK